MTSSMWGRFFFKKIAFFHRSSAELAGHQIPETVTTPMVDLIVEEEFDVQQVTEPLRRLEQELKGAPTDTTFSVVELGEVKSADEATCQPLDLRTPKAGAVVEGAIMPEDVDEEEIVEMGGDEQIRVAVPGKTATPAESGETGPTVAQEEEEEEGNDEALVVVSIDGALQETLRVEYVNSSSFSNNNYYYYSYRSSS